MKCQKCGKEADKLYCWVTGSLCPECFAPALKSGLANVNKELAKGNLDLTIDELSNLLKSGKGENIMDFEGKYFFTELVEQKPKTDVYALMSKHFDELGIVKWYAPWRQYCFFPSDETVWSKDCLSDVNTFISKLMQERKETKK